MSYVPNPSDPTEPVASRTVESAAREFREIKGLLARSLSFPAADTPTNRGLLPPAADRAGRVLQFNATTGVPETGATVSSLMAAESNAANSAASAANSAASAAQITALYLGVQASDPATNLSGGALVQGNWYINSTTGFIRVRISNSWVEGVSAGVNLTGNQTIGGVKTFTSAPVVPGINGGQLAGMRNKIINGGFQVAQRGSVNFSSNAIVYGGCDRWISGLYGYTTASGTIGQAGYVGAPNNTSTGFVQQLFASTTGSGIITFQQFIEAVNASNLNGKTITVSVSLYQDTGSTLSPTLNLYKPNALDSWSASTFITGTDVSLPSGAMTKFTWTVTLGSSDASNGLGIVVNFPTGALTNKYFQIADVQLEVGSVATPFEHRPYGTELALCQRYFQSFFRPSLRGSAMTSVLNRIAMVFPVTMRAAPTASTSGTHYWFDGTGTGTFTSFTLIASDVHSVEFDATPATGTLGAGRATGTYKDSANTGVLNLSAEL